MILACTQCPERYDSEIQQHDCPHGRRVGVGGNGGSHTPATAGIAPESNPERPLHVLQFSSGTRQAGVTALEASAALDKERLRVLEAARRVFGARPDGLVPTSLYQLRESFAYTMLELVSACPPGPERSTAISRLREAHAWALAAIVNE